MKKKIFGITLAVCLLVLSIAGTTVAYFTDTAEKAQAFTAGNVKIEFEASTGTIDERVYPGIKIPFDAKVKNVGTEEAYVGAVITLNKIDTENGQAVVDLRALDIQANPEAGVEALPLHKIFGWANDVNVKIVHTEYTAEACKIYVIYDAAVEKMTTATLYDNVTIPTAWGNEEMALFNGAKITVAAYATQTAGFTTGAQDALKAAFPEVWTLATNP